MWINLNTSSSDIFIKGILTRRISTPVGTRSYVRVRVYRGRGGKIYVDPLALTWSGIQSTLVKGNGILVHRQIHIRS